MKETRLINGINIEDGQEIGIIDEKYNNKYLARIVFGDKKQRVYMYSNFRNRNGYRPEDNKQPKDYIFSWACDIYDGEILGFKLVSNCEGFDKIIYLGPGKKFFINDNYALYVKEGLALSGTSQGVLSCCGAKHMDLIVSDIGKSLSNEDFLEALIYFLEDQLGNGLLSKDKKSINITIFIEKDIWPKIEGSELFIKLGETKKKVFFINKETYGT